jgi:hypothetical protein
MEIIGHVVLLRALATYFLRAKIGICEARKLTVSSTLGELFQPKSVTMKIDQSAILPWWLGHRIA